jgi:hypothetical protein
MCIYMSERWVNSLLALALVTNLCKHGPNHSDYFGRINVRINSGDTRRFWRLYMPVSLRGTNFGSEQQTSLIEGTEEYRRKKGVKVG